MPLRLAAPASSAWRTRHVIAGILVVAAGVIAVQQLLPAARHRQEADAQSVAAAKPAPAAAAHGPWTIVFERPSSCTDECERVLDALAAVARDPASGVPDGAARVVVKDAQGPAARDLVVLDPEGQPAGFILHTTDAGRIVSGLATLRAAESTAGAPLASR